MPSYPSLEKPHQPDWEALIDNLLRKGTPKRVHHMELFHDQPIMDEIMQRYDLDAGLDPDDPHYADRRYIAFRRFLGFDYVSVGLVDLAMPTKHTKIEDSADLAHEGGRSFMEEHKGPITTWEEFENYPWPDPDTPSATRQLEWYHENLPDDMCIASHTGHFDEYLCWLMGYESLCYALYDQRDLVQAIHEKLLAFHTREVERVLEYDRVRMVWGSDDMGFKTGLLFSRDDTRKFVLSGHKKLAQLAHDAGRLYLLHACGNLTEIIDDLTDDVKLDGKHSFEDTIEDVRDLKHTYGRKMALIGGIDVDFICRASVEDIRTRVRDTLDTCMPGGGYCLGTGNSVANYVPVDNYLAMIDEGWRYSEDM